MLDRLPDFLDPILYAEQRRETAGQMAVAGFARLSEILKDNSGKIAVDFSFEKKGRVATIQGSIKGELVLVCQNCLQELIVHIDIPVNLGVVSTLEQADRLAAEFDPLWMDEETISLQEIVEDELLLALPDFPRHSHECVKHEQAEPASIKPDDENNQQKSNNPFSVLAQLKKNTGDL